MLVMRAGLMAGAAGISVCLCASAMAQTTPAVSGDQMGITETPGTASAEDAAAAQGGLGDIVVTGRKRVRGEALQNTPLAITALGPAQLQSQSVEDLVDVGRLVPNASLQSSSQRGLQNFSIRGMGITASTASDEPAVGMIQDGVYWGSNYGAVGQLLDLEGVEIMRGPQGTLFGRNVTGGAAVIRTARPTNDYYAKLSVGVGNIGAVEGSAVGNLPLVHQTLAARIAVMVQRDRGYLRDTYNGGHFGGTQQYVVRPSIKWTPASNFDFTVIGEYYRLRGDPVGARGQSPNTIPGAAPTLPTREGYFSPDYYWSVAPNDRGFSEVDTRSVTAEANWQVLGGVITSVAGYRKVRSRVETDYDGFPSNGFFQFVSYDQHQFSEELRYAADITNWLSLTSGFYYFTQKVRWGEFRDLNNHASRIAARSDLDNTSYAGFAEVDLKPLDGLTITLGGRYTHETKDARAAPFGTCTPQLTNCGFSTWRHYAANKFTPKIGASYQISTTKLVYASYTVGFRSGGFALRGTPIAEPYVAEVVDAYEAGFKTDWLNRRLRINAALFQNEFSNLQRNVIGVSAEQGVIQSTFNAASATIKGGEVEVTLLVGGGLTLSGNYGLTHARYNSFQGFANPRSLRFTRIPEHTANFALDYLNEFPNGDKLAANVGTSYTSSYKWDDLNTPTLETPSVWLVNSTVSYTFNDRFSIAVWGKNLTNRKFAVWGSNLGALGQNSFPTPPRTYGIRLTAELD